MALTACLGLSACGSDAPPEDPRGTDWHTSQPDPCGDPEAFPPQGTLGQRVGDDFTPYGEDEPVRLQYGSQAGMGLGVALQLNDLDLSEVERIEVDLVVEGTPLGTFAEEGPSLTCQDGFSYFEAMVMLDVVAHPTVASVAQLDERPALVELRVFSETDLLIEESSMVTLRL